jgi:uncharacterized protein
MEFTKWGGARHWHYALDELGSDVFGTWFTGPPGLLLQRGDEPPIQEANGFVKLVPVAGEWIALWRAGGDVAIYVDVTDTPRRVCDRIEAIDLDLDVIALRDGRVFIDDVDEFEDHRIVLGYPTEVVASARATAAWLLEHVEAKTPPFDETGRLWLAKAATRWTGASESDIR